MAVGMPGTFHGTTHSLLTRAWTAVYDLLFAFQHLHASERLLQNSLRFVLLD
jgi:hypothetical protein